MHAPPTMRLSRVLVGALGLLLAGPRANAIGQAPTPGIPRASVRDSVRVTRAILERFFVDIQLSDRQKGRAYAIIEKAFTESTGLFPLTDDASRQAVRKILERRDTQLRALLTLRRDIATLEKHLQADRAHWP